MLAEVLQESSQETVGFWFQTFGDKQIPLWLLCIGFFGQAMFFSRFLVQWVVSEKMRKSVIPMAFWYLSLGGGSILFLYAFLNSDPVIMLGQAVGTFVYVRNILLRKREAAVVVAED